MKRILGVIVLVGLSVGIKSKLLRFTLLMLLVVNAASNSYAQTFAQDGYDLLGYRFTPTENRVARLAAKLDSGEVSLSYDNEHGGFLASFLEALEIDVASQLLIFSKTSLQYRLISSETPRAIYFNEDTYIGWVDGSEIVEVMTLDDSLGLVFYVFNNSPDSKTPIVRGDTCLGCHDSNSGTGYGVPAILARSAIYNKLGESLVNFSGLDNVTDSFPFDERWGGWYVTGQHGEQTHMGNIELEDESELPRLESYKRGNIDSLAELGMFNLDPYLTDTSDIVAFMLLEHQLTVQNRIIYIKFKGAELLARVGMSEMAGAPSWEALLPQAQQRVTRMLDRLVQALLLKDRVTLVDNISGSEKFVTWFQEGQGKTDEQGNSLRELDLETRLLKYPLSYLIASDELTSLPGYAKDYVFLKITEILEGRNQDAEFSYISREEREAVLKILRSSNMEITAYLDTQQ